MLLWYDNSMKYELQHRLIRKLINMKAQTLLKAKKYTGILPFLSGICWGATGIFVRTLENAGVDNFTIISCRMLLAALITGICMLIYNRSLFHVNLKDLWLFIASGMIGMTALSIFYNISVSSSSLALAAVLLAMCPVFVLFLAAIFFHEKITGRKTGCVILALTGCVLVSGVFEKGGLAWSVRGIVCGLLACFFYASYSLVSKRMTQKNYHFLTITFYGTLFSGLSMLPFSNMHTIRALCTPAYFSYTGVMFVHALISSVLPYALFSLYMRYMETGKASILASIEPAAAMIFGAVLYSETPSLLSVLGLCFTIAAVVLLNVPEKDVK